jgi:hypothetical protein
LGFRVSSFPELLDCWAPVPLTWETEKNKTLDKARKVKERKGKERKGEERKKMGREGIATT